MRTIKTLVLFSFCAVLLLSAVFLRPAYAARIPTPQEIASHCSDLVSDLVYAIETTKAAGVSKADFMASVKDEIAKKGGDSTLALALIAAVYDGKDVEETVAKMESSCQAFYAKRFSQQTSALRSSLAG